MTQPISEQLFETFCTAEGLDCVRLEESRKPGVRTPDYLLTIEATKIAVEVKQFDPNEGEAEASIRMAAGQIVTSGSVPGHRLRGILSAAASQLKSRTHLETPGLLVLYDNTGSLDEHLDAYHIKAAMYGLEQLVFRQTPDGPHLSKQEDVKFGPKRKLTPDRNRAVSAVCRLHRCRRGFCLDVFHNTFAAAPLEPASLRSHAIRHFRLTDKVLGQGQDWEELV